MHRHQTTGCHAISLIGSNRHLQIALDLYLARPPYRLSRRLDPSSHDPIAQQLQGFHAGALEANAASTPHLPKHMEAMSSALLSTGYLEGARDQLQAA